MSCPLQDITRYLITQLLVCTKHRSYPTSTANLLWVLELGWGWRNIFPAEQKHGALVGGFKYFFVFTPIWGRFPCWRAYFSKGLVQPPTRAVCHQIFVESFGSYNGTLADSREESSRSIDSSEKWSFFNLHAQVGDSSHFLTYFIYSRSFSHQDSTLQNQQSTHALELGSNPCHQIGSWDVWHFQSSTWKKPRNKKCISVAGGNMWNQGSKNSSTIQTQTWLVRRYAFQHPQRAGDIARLLPSSFILRNPRDCKDFQRQAGWNMWKCPAFPAYEHSW